MSETAGAIGMYKWIQAVSLRSSALACHLELRECFDGKAISELKEELSKLREAHAEEVQALKAKLKTVEHKCSAQEKERASKEKSFQDRVAILEGKMKEHEDYHGAMVAKFKEAISNKDKEIEDPKVKQPSSIQRDLIP